jgi:hypothetical protein
MRFKVATLAKLPVEQPTKFEMSVNGKAAKALGDQDSGFDYAARRPGD